MTDEQWLVENWPTIAHEARAERRSGGHARWHATCTCGWATSWAGSKEDNELLARLHQEGQR